MKEFVCDIYRPSGKLLLYFNVFSVVEVELYNKIKGIEVLTLTILIALQILGFQS